MKKGQKLWTRDELIIAINLYCKIPFGKLHSRNQQIIELALLLGRSPNAVAMKLVNFASLDPSLHARGIKGMGRGAKLDKVVWDEFYNNWDAAFLESEKLLAQYKDSTIESEYSSEIEDLKSYEAIDKKSLVNTRIKQGVFRKIVLANYNSTCCITGISQQDLLIASHIVPWSKDAQNRLNPMNGLCLNALHDRAFDKGLITVDAYTYRIKLSSKLKSKSPKNGCADYFEKYEGLEIKLPTRFLPDREFLMIHNSSFIP